MICQWLVEILSPIGSLPVAKVHQIDPKKLSAASYADQRPLVPNTSEENRAKNRRIEILIVQKQD